MAGVAALAIARFNSRRVRLISWWLRMTLMRRDIVTILSSTRVFGIFEFEDHWCNAGRGRDIPVDRAERRLLGDLLGACAALARRLRGALRGTAPARASKPAFSRAFGCGWSMVPFQTS